MKPSLFRNYILLSIAITMGVLFLGFATTRYLTHLQREKSMPPFNSPVFIARLMDEVEPLHHVKAFETVQKSLDESTPYNLWLVSEAGDILKASNDRPFPLEWKKIQLPTVEHEIQHVDIEVGGPGSGGPGGPGGPPPPPESHFFSGLFMPGPGGPGGPGFGGDRKRAGFWAQSFGVIRLKGEPATYLAFELRPRRPPGMESEFYIIQGMMLLSIITASLITFGLISLHLRRKARVAEEVMKQMQEGNLKARFPVTRNDELGRFMLLFNKMGDDIERLVEKTKKTEQSRLFILQELAHDLRTPIASLKSMLETLIDGRENVPPKITEELLNMSVEEVNYFARLVEDLLLLARVLEPEYHFPPQKTDWLHMLEDEVSKLNLQQTNADHKIQIHLLIAEDLKNKQILGDEHLLQRVFRNALQNSMTYARSEVNLKITMKSNTQMEFLIQDDGRGFDAGMLESFGERRVSRFLSSQKGTHLSVGLGSVIIKKVVLAHQGEVQARNRLREDGTVCGAEVLITLTASDRDSDSRGEAS